MSVLVTGGAGYIGSHAVLQLLDKGESVVVIDNLETGFKEAIDKRAEFVAGDLRDKDFLARFFGERKIDAVMHFAAYSLVGESVQNPLKYYQNNVFGAVNLLNAMQNSGVDKFVFSSTAAVYGEQEKMPICEDFNTSPENPYGETKLAVEKALKWFNHAYGIKYAVLRYFNVAGAQADGERSGKMGEAHNPETHLIPIILKEAALARAEGRNARVNVFGGDYNTPDGTCIRDYIHVSDLVGAHALALYALRCGDISAETFNLGSANGFSVKEIIEAAQTVTGVLIEPVIQKRRAGDPSRLVASAEKIKNMLGYSPNYDDINDIIGSAWNWHKNNPHGYTESYAKGCE